MTSHQRGWLLPPASAAIVAGVFLGRITDHILFPLIACILSFFVVFLQKGRIRFAACIAFTFALGVCLGCISFHPLLPEEGDYEINGVINDEISYGSFGQVRVFLSDVQLDKRPYSGGAYWTFYTNEEIPSLSPGKQVHFYASLYHPGGAVNPNGYDFRETLLQHGVTIGLYGKELLTISDPSGFSFSGKVAEIRHHLSISLISSLGQETGSYASALLLGMRSLIPSEDRQAFSRLGIAHVLSVSGFHVGILIGALSFLFSRLHLRQEARLSVYCIVLFLYAAICGMSQPVIRASLFLVLALEGKILNRPRSGIHVFCAVLFIMTLLSPVQVTSVSFQLTFCAMAGLIWFSPLTRHTRSIRNKCIRKLCDSLILTFGIQLGLLIPELAVFQRLPILVFLVNIPALILSGVMISAFWAFMILFPFPGVLSLLSVPLSSFSGFLLSTVRSLGSLPGLTLWFHVPTIWTVLGVICVFASSTSLIHIRLLFRFGSLTAGVLLIIISLLPLPHSDTEYIQFSVGNADAAVIWDQDKVYVMDTGEADGILSSFLRSHRLVPDAVILTHLHADHAGGLRSMMEDEIPVSLLYLPEGADMQSVHPDFLFMLQELQDSGTEIRTLSRGDILPLPSGTLTVLWPEKGRTRLLQDANQYSLVTRIVLNGTVLLQTGDVTGSYESYCSCPADILKASHHGSSFSTLPGYLSDVSPRTIILSCRRISRLASFRERTEGIPVYGTPESGAITIRFDDSGYTVIPYLNN